MAQRYRKIDPRIWTDERFTRLPVEGRLLALWMLTSARVNRCGLLVWSPGLASEETGIARNRVETVYDTVCDTLRWVKCEDSRVVFLTRWWRYNRPDNESALKGALADLHDMPTNNLKPALLKAMSDLPTPYHRLYGTTLDTVYDTVPDTVSPQEQEQEQEQEQDTPQPPGGVSEAEFMEAWNGLGKPFPEVQSMTPKRRTAFASRLRDSFWRDHWREAMGRLSSSTFLRGEGERGWVANVDWFLKPDSVQAVIEGKYAGANGKSPPKSREAQIDEVIAAEQAKLEAAERKRQERMSWTGTPPGSTPTADLPASATTPSSG